MNKAEADKARKKLNDKVKRELRKGTKPRAIAEATGYTTARIYQIRGQLVEAGELEPLPQMETRAEAIAAWNTRAAPEVSDWTGPVAWTVVGPDGKSSIGGWQDWSSHKLMSEIGVLRDGHRYAYAYTRTNALQEPTP